MTIFGRRVSLNMLVLLLLVVIAFISSVGSLIVDSTDRSAEWWSGWLQNFSTEVFGAIMTFALFELLVGGRKETADIKARLIREAGSKDNATALKALREIRDRGWIEGNASIFLGMDLRNANLEGVNLIEANLGGSSLGRVNLKGAKLHNTDLGSANLRNANLEGADLFQSNLEGASLRGVKLKNACVYETFFNRETTLPNGEKWTPETDMTQFGCFVDRDKWLEWRKSQGFDI